LRQEKLKERVKALRARGVIPTIAPILIRGNPAGEVYYKSKKNLSRELGIGFQGVILPKETNEVELIDTIHRLNADPTVHGIFLELPLPAQIPLPAVGREIAPEKDIDAINPVNLGRLILGGTRDATYAELKARPDLLLPATPQGVMELLLAAGVELAGKEVVIVGGGTVGLSLSLLILRQGYGDVTLCEYQGKDLREIVPRGDVVCACAGRPNLITPEMVKEGAVVIDIGINVTEKGICGDVDFEAAKEKASLITPVPGGVGPMTTTMIMENTVKAAENLSAG